MTDIINLSNKAQRLYQRAGKAAYSGNYLDAVFYYKQAVKAEPDNVEYLSDLSSALNQVAHYEDSIIYAARALSLTEDKEITANLYYLLGEAYMGISMFSEAYNMLNKSIYTNPNGQFLQDAEALLGDLAEYTGSSEESQINDADYYFKLSAVEFQYYNSLYNDALKSLEEFEARYGADANSNAVKIPILIALERYEDALRLIHKQIKTDSDDFASAAYGLLASRMCNKETKFNSFKKLLMDVEDYSENDINLVSDVFDKIQDTDLAYHFFLKLSQENNYDYQILHGLAAAFYNKNDKEHAAVYWGKLLKLEGGFGVAEFYLDHLYDRKEPVSYRFSASDAMLKEYDTKISGLLAVQEDAEQLYEPVKLLLQYQNPEQVVELLKKLPVHKEPVQRALRELLLSFSLPMQVKLMLVKSLEENLAEKPILINLGNAIADSASLFEKESGNPVKKIEISERLTLEYTPEQLYYGLMSFSMMDSNPELTNDELSLCIELLICDKYRLDSKNLAEVYQMDSERYHEIEALLRESGLIGYETV